MKHKHVTSILLTLLTFMGVLVACQPDTEPPAPEISSIKPATGSAGDHVTVVGTNLGQTIEQIKISFGATRSTPITVSPGQVEVIVPEIAPGAYTLKAELGDRASVKDAVKFTVVKKPVNPMPDPFDALAPGSLDPIFGINGVVRSKEKYFLESPESSLDWFIQPDGKFVMVSGNLELYRWNLDTSPDKSFGIDGVTKLPYRYSPYTNANPKIKFSSDGRYLVTLNQNLSSSSDFQVSSISSNGIVDSKFASGGSLALTNFETQPGKFFYDAAPVADGKVLLIGGDSTKSILRRYLPNGEIDKSFNGNGETTFTAFKGSNYATYVLKNNSFAIYRDEKSQFSSEFVSKINKVDSNGNLNQDFNFDNSKAFKKLIFEPSYYLCHCISEKNGVVYIINKSEKEGFASEIDRLLPNGLLDEFFQISTKMDVSDLVLDSKGSIVLLGSTRNPTKATIEKYYSDGTTDTKFGTSGFLSIPNNDSETIATTLSGFVDGDKLFVYGIFGSVVYGSYAPNYRIFSTRIKY